MPSTHEILAAFVSCGVVLAVMFFRRVRFLFVFAKIRDLKLADERQWLQEHAKILNARWRKVRGAMRKLKQARRKEARIFESNAELAMRYESFKKLHEEVSKRGNAFLAPFNVMDRWLFFHWLTWAMRKRNTNVF